MRAVALFGVLVMNAPWFFNSWWFDGPEAQQFPATLDRVALFVMDTVFKGKANSLLSLLFGIGFCLQYTRLQAQGAAASVYLRRVVFLALLGLLHALLFWTGDVLHVYALLGLSLPLVVRVPQRVLLLGLIALCASGPLVSVLSLWPFSEANLAECRGLGNALFGRMSTAFGASDVWPMVSVRLAELSLSYACGFLPVFVGSMAFTMLLGVYALRAGWITRPVDLRSNRRALLLAFSIGISATLVAAVLGPLAQPYQRTWVELVAGAASVVQRPALMIGYAMLLLAWGQRLDATRGFGRALVRTGRMPLTIYLSQTVILTTLAYGYGLGLFGRVGPALALAMALVLFPLQVLWADWYLGRHRFGPLETLWRRVSYGPQS